MKPETEKGYIVTFQANSNGPILTVRVPGGYWNYAVMDCELANRAARLIRLCGVPCVDSEIQKIIAHAEGKE